MLLRFKELSPPILNSTLGVEASIPIKSLDKVPEYPKFNLMFFPPTKEPRPLP